jgi:hypothetical protein
VQSALLLGQSGKNPIDERGSRSLEIDMRVNGILPIDTQKELAVHSVDTPAVTGKHIPDFQIVQQHLDVQVHLALLKV